MTALTSESDRTAKQPIGWLRGPWGVAGIIAALYSAVHVIWSFAHWGGEAAQAAISDIAFLPISLFAALAAFRIWTQPGVDPSTRLAWGLLGLGLLKFPHSPVSRSDQRRLYLDSAVVLVASWMVIWYFILLNKELLLRLKQLDETGPALNRAEYMASIGTF
jgi:hypothetical protein